MKEHNFYLELPAKQRFALQLLYLTKRKTAVLGNAFYFSKGFFTKK